MVGLAPTVAAVKVLAPSHVTRPLMPASRPGLRAMVMVSAVPLMTPEKVVRSHSPNMVTLRPKVSAPVKMVPIARKERSELPMVTVPDPKLATVIALAIVIALSEPIASNVKPVLLVPVEASLRVIRPVPRLFAM